MLIVSEDSVVEEGVFCSENLQVSLTEGSVIKKGSKIVFLGSEIFEGRSYPYINLTGVTLDGVLLVKASTLPMIHSNSRNGLTLVNSTIKGSMSVLFRGLFCEGSACHFVNLDVTGNLRIGQTSFWNDHLSPARLHAGANINNCKVQGNLDISVVSPNARGVSLNGFWFQGMNRVKVREMNYDPDKMGNAILHGGGDYRVTNRGDIDFSTLSVEIGEKNAILLDSVGTYTYQGNNLRADFDGDAHTITGTVRISPEDLQDNAPRPRIFGRENDAGGVPAWVQTTPAVANWGDLDPQYLLAMRDGYDRMVDLAINAGDEASQVTLAPRRVEISAVQTRINLDDLTGTTQTVTLREGGVADARGDITDHITMSLQDFVGRPLTEVTRRQIEQRAADVIPEFVRERGFLDQIRVTSDHRRMFIPNDAAVHDAFVGTTRANMQDLYYRRAMQVQRPDVRIDTALVDSMSYAVRSMSASLRGEDDEGDSNV